jgi:SAM-dependent methyltransferase
MYPDVVDLREFYESDLGQLTRRLVRDGVRRLWPSVSGDTLVGIGFATPYLRPFMQEAEHLLAFMPAQQGVTWWPREGPNATALIDERHIPLPDQSVDKIILVHALENTEHIGDMLQEAWRILKPQGRMMVIVPNRSGFWARSSKSPFGFGFSFSLPHIRRVLSHNNFQVERHTRAVFVPPFAAHLAGKSIDWLEHQGQKFLSGLAGGG